MLTKAQHFFSWLDIRIKHAHLGCQSFSHWESWNYIRGIHRQLKPWVWLLSVHGDIFRHLKNGGGLLAHIWESYLELSSMQWLKTKHYAPCGYQLCLKKQYALYLYTWMPAVSKENMLSMSSKGYNLRTYMLAIYRELGILFNQAACMLTEGLRCWWTPPVIEISMLVILTTWHTEMMTSGSYLFVLHKYGCVKTKD